MVRAPAIDALRSAMELSHRRIQTEAAGALVRLGNSEGEQRLIELAADPVARTRAVAYADEFGISERIDESHRLPHALAESELAAWLAEPGQYGVAPTGLQLLDSRTFYWPSYEEPRICYLFKFWYELPQGRLQNIGIAGPMTHAFQTRLEEFELNDIYAIFAGWHVENEDIFDIAIHQLNAVQRDEADRLAQRLYDAEFENVELHSLAFFLTDFSLVAKASKRDQALLVVADGAEVTTLPFSDSPFAATPEILISLYRGRRLLKAFNESFDM